MSHVKDRLRTVAAESDFHYEDLIEADEQLETALQNSLHKHFRRSKLEGGYDYWLVEDERGDNGVWLALNWAEIREDLREADIEFDEQAMQIVAHEHLEWFQEVDGLTIRVPGGAGRSYRDPFFYAIHVEYPEGWMEGQYHTRQRFQELVSRYDMSPAEALDYWTVEHAGADANIWAGKRGVDAEAVRKNVRQAREKIQDEDLGASHESATFGVVDVEELPEDKPHDDEQDVFYIPTAEAAEDYDISPPDRE